MVDSLGSHTHIVGSYAHIYKHIVGSYVHTNINHRLIYTHTHRHTHITYTNSRHRHITYTHLQMHSRLICTHKHTPQAHMHIYKHTIGTHTHTHTLRFVGGQVGRLLPADTTISIPISPRPSPLAGPPFSPSLPSAPHWVRSRLTHCSSRGNGYSHLTQHERCHRAWALQALGSGGVRIHPVR